MYIKLKNNYITSLLIETLAPEEDHIYIDHTNIDLDYFLQNYILYTYKDGQLQEVRRFMKDNEFVIKKDIRNIERYYLERYQTIAKDNIETKIILKENIDHITFMEYYISSDGYFFTLKEEIIDKLEDWDHERINFTT